MPTLRIIGTDPPGRHCCEGLDVRGPCVQGRPDDRFVYLTWGHVDADGFALFSRAKLMLDAVDHDTWAAADQEGDVLEGRLDLTDDAGQPRCAAVRPPVITWAIAPR